MSQTPRCQARNRCDPERQLMNIASRADKTQHAFYRAPLGIPMSRRCLVLFFVLICGCTGLFNRSIQPAVAQVASEPEKIGEFVKQNQNADDEENRLSAEADQENATVRAENAKVVDTSCVARWSPNHTDWYVPVADG